MDPVTILSAASLAFNGVKKAIQVGRDMEDIFKQLSVWSGHVSDLQEWMGQEKKYKKPTLWQKLTWDKSETAEAFDELIAKKKIKEMEDAIRHEFTWGKLHHLGMDGPYGYRAFVKIRREVRAKRKAEIYDQMRRRKAFWYNTKMGMAIGTLVLILIYLCHFLWTAIIEASK
jgi:hypothetical protein